MKDVVSFETAKRLKRAGFPSPNQASATDILKELGYDFALKFFDDSKKFCCWQDNQDGSWETWTNKNPAEAAASAYLSIHEKTANQ